MYEPTRIFRSLLLCGIVYTVTNSIQIANALDTTYEIGGVTRTGEFIPNPAGANGSKTVYAPMSASKMPNGTRIPYGLRGTLRTGSKLFKQLLIAEAGLEVVDWIKSQYDAPAESINLENWSVEESVTITDWHCTNTECYFHPLNDRTKNFDSSASALAYDIKNVVLCTQCYSQVSNITNIADPPYYDIRGNIKVFDYDGNEIASGTIGVVGKSNQSVIVGEKQIISNRPLGEPTIKPNPWKSGEIIEAYAGKIGGWGDFVSPNVQILDQPVRWTELPAPAGMPTVDTITDLIRVPSYEPKPPAIIPDPEPLRPDPDGLKKIPNPLLQGLPDPTTPNPPPAVRTQDLIGGGMTVTNTYNIQNTSTAVNLNIENKEISYAGNEEEIKTPADLTETETLEARQRLLIPTTDETFMNSYVQNILSKVPVPQVNLLSDSSAKCPPPRRLALFGTTEIELSYEGICQFLPMVKVLMLGFIGFALFGVWIKRISSS